MIPYRITFYLGGSEVSLTVTATNMDMAQAIADSIQKAGGVLSQATVTITEVTT